MSTDRQFIVAEISKNWLAGEPGPEKPDDYIGAKFEGVIAVNLQRGYKLHSFQLHRLMVSDTGLNETIIAVFEKVAA